MSDRNTVTIVLYPDYSLGFYSNEVNKSNFIKGARLFEVSDELPIIIVYEWIAKGYNHIKVREI